MQNRSLVVVPVALLVVVALGAALISAVHAVAPPPPMRAKASLVDLVPVTGDLPEFKKLLKSRTNLLLLIADSENAAASVLPAFGETATAAKGKASLAFVNCAVHFRICKFLKAEPDTFVVKHYAKGEFHVDYTRPLTAKSMLNFLNKPDDEAPWDEDPAAADVVHADDKTWPKILARNKKTLVMLYASWCGHCKRMKPDFALAATALKAEGALLVAINAEGPDAAKTRAQYGVTGYPTVLFFDKGAKVGTFEGERTKDGIIAFMRDPYNPEVSKPKAPAAAEPAWKDTPSNVHHLTDETFDTFLAENPSVLVMFYAPWCGHCKSMKPELNAAADTMLNAGSTGKMAAVDCTQESKVCGRFGVKGYPTVKYFGDGEFKFDYGTERKQAALVKFMENPSEPPPPPPPEPAWADSPSAENIAHLTEETFEETLKRKKHALVMFYASWCGHCKAMKPELEKAADQLKDNRRVLFAAVDATKETQLATQFNVKGYPTIKVFSYGNLVRDYSGGRKLNDLVKFFEEEL